MSTEPEKVAALPDVSSDNGDEMECMDQSLIDRVSNRQPHRFLRRGICFGHRDFNQILDAYERGDDFYMYLQNAFNVPVIVQLNDDCQMRKDLTVEERQSLARDQAKEIIACGFDLTKTFIYYVRDCFGGAYYENVVKFGKIITLEQAKGMLGLCGGDSVGNLNVIPLKAVPSFPNTFPHLFPANENLRCLVSCGIDEVSCFRMARDIAPQLGYSKPGLIVSSVFPASDPSSAISVNDTAEDIKKKINKYVYVGGKGTMNEQQDLGANLEMETILSYLTFFLEDDNELQRIKKEYGAGKMLSERVRERLVEVLTEIIERHKTARAAVSDEMVGSFMATRSLIRKSDSKSSRHKSAASLQPSYHPELHRVSPPVVDKKNEREHEPLVQVVNPWSKKSDYDKLIDYFGFQRFHETLISRLQRLTYRRPHVLLRRGVFFGHRDFNDISDAYERGEKFYLYTGRGPSSEALHLGHLIPFMFTKYLQEAFKVPLVIQLSDDEKCMWKGLTVEESKRRTRENAKDIIACGFYITKTFIFSDFDYVGGAFYDNMQKVADCVTIDKAFEIFGFSDEDHIGKFSFSPVQAAPSFPSSFPHLFAGKDNIRCLIPCGIDQDPYFTMARDVATGLGYSKPALIESSLLRALQGENGKMSASDPNSAIYVTDTAEDIKKKINSVFSGAKEDNAELQRIVGAFLEYLHIFLDDDSELESIKKYYGAGIVLPEDVKDRLIELLTEIVERHQMSRAAVTDEMVDMFMERRKLPNMFRTRRWPVDLFTDWYRNGEAKRRVFDCDKSYEPSEPQDPLGYMYNGVLTAFTQGLFRRLEYYSRESPRLIHRCNHIASASQNGVATVAEWCINEPSPYTTRKVYKGAAGIYAMTRFLVPTMIGIGLQCYSSISEARAEKKKAIEEAAWKGNQTKFEAYSRVRFDEVDADIRKLDARVGRMEKKEKMFFSLMGKKTE